MSDVTLTGGIRANLLSLQNTTRMIEDTQFKMSTGKKVNSALDNAVSFFKAQSLNFRANDLALRKDGIQQGMNVLDAADKGISAIMKLVEQAEAKAVQATELTVNPDKASVGIDPAATASVATAEAVASISAGGATVKIEGNGKTIELTYASGDTAHTWTELVADANALSAGLTLSFDSGSTAGRLQISGADSVTITVSDTAGTVGGALDAAAGATQIVTADQAYTDSLNNLETDYQEILTQIDTLAKDASFQGMNLINEAKADKMTVKFNEDGTNTLSVDAKNLTSSGLSLATTSLLDGGAEAAQTALDSATTTLRDAASSFGTSNAILDTRNDFTNNMVNALEKGAGDLVNADMNEESANMLALQTRQQLGTISLSIANQAEQSVLRLF